jgi:uncharacterized membrane protein YfcA
VIFALFLAAAALVSGAVAAVTGFGVGSLLTPALALRTGTKLAVAAIAIPHFIGTAQRFWMLRQHVDRQVLVGFGIASAVGGLAGALVHTRVSSGALAVVFGSLLVLAGLSLRLTSRRSQLSLFGRGCRQHQVDTPQQSVGLERLLDDDSFGVDEALTSEVLL